MIDDLEAAIKKARDVMEAARKKLQSTGKAGPGAEDTYAAAARRLARLDPMFRLPKGQK